MRSGRLHRIHRGVYAVGHPGPSEEGGWMAAVLARGDGAVLGHQSARRPGDLSRGPASPTSRSRATPGASAATQIVLHRSSTLLPSHRTMRAGIPVTKPARTLEDLRRVLPTDEFNAALRQAECLRLPLGERSQPDHTRGELEAIFLRPCGRLPAPGVNARLGPHVVDFLWRERRLSVESDGYGAHATRLAFERDRVRDAALTAAGYEILRFARRQLTEDAATVAARVRSVLGKRLGQTYD